MKCDISISRMEVFARHGVLPQERLTGARFHVSMQAQAEISALAYEQDNLEGTVSYATLTEIIQQEMDKPSRLLEHVAYRIGQHVLDECPAISDVRVSIEKENPPLGIQADAIGVTLSFSRSNPSL